MTKTKGCVILYSILPSSLFNEIMGIEAKFNWLDVLVFLILVRIIYTAVSKGFVNEFFKLLATLLGIFFSFQFYSLLAEFILKYFPPLGDFSKVLTFSLIYITCWIIMGNLREVVKFLFKVEAHSVIERWFSLFFGIFRAFLSVSLTFFILFLFNVSYIKDSLNGSLSFSLLKNLAPRTYLFCAETAGKIIPTFRVNTLEDY